jgi:ATP-dependent Lhr-like helicase
MDLLVQEGRACRVKGPDRSYWIATEARSLCPVGMDGAPSTEAGGLIIAVIRGWIEVSGPVVPDDLAAALGFSPESVRAALLGLEGEGLVLRGFFSDSGHEEFCDRRILARIHRSTVAHLRREIEPVSPAVFLRFLFEWQHVEPEMRLTGESGVLEIVEQLQGYETAAIAWEDEILGARISDYQPSFLDSLCLGGEIVWGRLRRRTTHAEIPSRRPGLTRTAVLGLAMREDMPWLLDETPADESALAAPARDTLGFLRRRGASFFSEIAAGARRLPSEVEEGLWQLVAAGLVTADAFAALRSLVSGETKRLERSRRRKRPPRRTREGRWSLLEIESKAPENRLERWADQYVRRYGILCRELLVREPSAPPWRNLLPALRRSEARGELRGGRFIAGLNGEQFALPEAVDALRAVRRKEAPGRYLRVSACDPLNLIGILTPGIRIAAVYGNRVVYRDGAPVAAFESGQVRLLSEVDASERRHLDRLLDVRPLAALRAPFTLREE